MNQEAVQVALAAHRSSPTQRTLIVDDDIVPTFEGESGVACLSQVGLAPEEMWACRGAGTLHLVVLSAPRSARELFRCLVLAERLVVPDGKILLLPVTDSASDEVRPEATEIFCGAYPEWSRRQVEGNVVELQRTGENPFGGQILDAEKTSKCVVSLSVFGDSRFGTDFWKRMTEFVANYVLAHHALFPGYELRIHHDEHLFHANGGDVLCGLARLGLVELVPVPSRPKCWAMLHRLLPAWDPSVDVVICRDVDSLPTWRDRCCVEEFVASGLDVGVIHDNPEHGGMMGGLSHFRAQALRERYASFDEFIAAAECSDEHWEVHGVDQIYLGEVVSRFGAVLEHSLRSRGTRTLSGSDFRTAIAPPTGAVRASVSAAVRDGSDALTNYMGSSGYQTALARAFYDNRSPAAEDVRAAEKFAREALLPGDGVQMTVSEKFLHGVDAWCNHRPLLYLALEETRSSGKPVLEMGMGEGSTPHLHDYLTEDGRTLYSYDSNGEWCERFAHLRSDKHSIRGVGQEWERVHDGTLWSVALVDHAPGERRYVDVERLLTACDVIVIHDSEPQATGYGLQNVWPLFKYRADVESPTAWATAVSNTVDVTKWRGQIVGGWRIS